MPFFLKRRVKKEKVGVEKKEMMAAIEKELAPYIKREELKEYLNKIEEDERKKKIWESLTLHKKIRFLRYLSERKHGKG